MSLPLLAQIAAGAGGAAFDVLADGVSTVVSTLSLAMAVVADDDDAAVVEGATAADDDAAAVVEGATAAADDDDDDVAVVDGVSPATSEVVTW
jgi:hypothetical protein